MYNSVKIMFLLVCLAVSASCSTIPISSQVRMATLDPATLDFSAIEVAVRINEDYKLRDGDVTLGLSLRDGLTNEEFVETFLLKVEDMPNSPFLKKDQKRETQIYGMSFDEADRARLLNFRDKFSELLARGKETKASGKNSFSLNVNTKGCLRKSGNPFEKMKVKVYLKPKPTAKFMTFIKERNINLVDQSNGNIPFCSEN